MGKVMAQAIMSLDGYIAKQDNSIGRLFPPGAGGFWDRDSALFLGFLGLRDRILGMEGGLLTPEDARIPRASQAANPLSERASASMELAGLEPATSWVRSRRSPS
jgi:hypothetical protein